MPEDVGGGRLPEAVAAVRARISKYSSSKNFNEENTKASLVVPILQALGWDTNDPDEVHWEYKAKPKYNPVDFALLLQRTPCLLIEAKALRDRMRDDKLLNQVLSYASVAGVQWIALTNGDEYRIYNAAVPVPAEEKLFRTITISRDPDAVVVSTLSLLSRANLQDKKIGRLWDANFVDRQVRSALDDILNPGDPKSAVVNALRKLTGRKLTVGAIRASLRRARISIEFPPEPDIGAISTTLHAKTAAAKKQRRARETGPRHETQLGVSLRDLIEAGILVVPAKLVCEFRGHRLEAAVDGEGQVIYQAKAYGSPSLAAAVARRPFYVGGLPKDRLPATNGWVFWKVVVRGEPLILDELRKQYTAGKKGQVARLPRAAGKPGKQ